MIYAYFEYRPQSDTYYLNPLTSILDGCKITVYFILQIYIVNISFAILLICCEYAQYTKDTPHTRLHDSSMAFLFEMARFSSNQIDVSENCPSNHAQNESKTSYNLPP